jgi:hypothetical protein
MDPTLDDDYPFVCRSIIQTGHLANIFNTEMLPYSSNMYGRSAMFYVPPNWLKRQSNRGRRRAGPCA